MSGITMSHDDTTIFCSFLQGTSHLEQIHLEAVKCECRNQHDVNFSNHQKLQYLYLNDAVSVIYVDATNLEIFRFFEVKNIKYKKIFGIIRKAYKLKELALYGHCKTKSQLYHTNITKRLVRVLPLLHNLSKLELWRFTLTDNIIQSPVEIKSLKNIKLYYVIMSLTTLQKFIDSFPTIPHTVDVSLLGCYISEGEEFTIDMSEIISEGQRGRINDAIQYVKGQDQLFHVKDDDKNWFEFSTKK
jgi:hypothetical protein